MSTPSITSTGQPITIPTEKSDDTIMTVFIVVMVLYILCWCCQSCCACSILCPFYTLFGVAASKGELKVNNS